MKCSVWFPWNEATKIIANIHQAFVTSYYYSYLHNKKTANRKREESNCNKFENNFVYTSASTLPDVGGDFE